MSVPKEYIERTKKAILLSKQPFGCICRVLFVSAGFLVRSLEPNELHSIITFSITELITAYILIEQRFSSPLMGK